MFLDGLPDQNERVAAALRAVIPADAPRIVAIDPDRNAFVDLPAGVTAEQISAGWRDVSEFDENEQVSPVRVVSAGAGGNDQRGVGTEGPARQVPFEARDAWGGPAVGASPSGGRCLPVGPGSAAGSTEAGCEVRGTPAWRHGSRLLHRPDGVAAA